MDSAGAVVRPPHQLIKDRRETASVGRRARLELVFGCRGGRTILKHAYAEPPFRAGQCFADGNGAHMIMASSAPGIFAGDGLTQHILVERGARVRLTSQSALQVHPSPASEPARLVSTYTVEDDAQLGCDWDPLIPFACARFDQRIDVRLAERASLFWSDAFMCGRVMAHPASADRASPGYGVARGERWAFAELSHELKISRAESLEYMERYRLTPEGGRPDRAWVAGDACYFGTTVSSGRIVEPARAAELQADLARVDTVRAAADRLHARLLLVRLMAESGARFREARALAARSLAPAGRA